MRPELVGWLPARIRSRVPQRRAYVIDHLPRGGAGVELGVWLGDFSDRLWRRTRPRALHLVDPWSFHADDGYADSWYGGARAHDQHDMDTVFAAVERRFVGRPRVHVHRETSLAAAARFEPGSLDWAYVDADHTHDAVLADLRAYWPLLRSGGVLAGDDYGVPGWWGDGVTSAVHAFVREREDVQVEGVHASQFVLRKSVGVDVVGKLGRSEAERRRQGAAPGDQR